MFTISILTDNELTDIVAIESKSFSLPKSEAVFRHDEHKYLVAKDNDKVLGYIGIEDIAGEKHIINVAVHPDFRKKGIAKKLVEKILNDKDVFFLEVRVSNQIAQNLYKKYNFEVVGTRKKYYSDNNEDAYIMKRSPM